MTSSVSFVVPVFNKKPFLPRVLSALQAQTGPFEAHYVFVDDGSTDGSLDELRRLTAGWKNVQIASQANGGAASATNHAIRLAQTDFIKFCDADDQLSVDATALLLDAMLRNDAVLAWGRAVNTDEAAPSLAPSGPISGEQVIEDALPALIRTSIFNPSQCMVRTDAVKKVGGADERTKHTQDYTIALRLSQLGRFVKIDNPVAYLPIEAPGRVTQFDPANQLSRVTRSLAYFFEDHPKADQKLLAFACRQAAGRVWKHERRHQGKKIWNSPWFWKQLAAAAFPPKNTAFLHECAHALYPKPY